MTEPIEEIQSKPLEILGDCLLLAEAASDGTYPVKIIQEGWGSTGYYSKSVLERDASKAFPSGTHMYWNHPTKREVQERRGQRDLNDLAGVLLSESAWSDGGFNGPGVYNRFKPFPEYVEAIRSMAGHIGVSIRAGGFGEEGQAGGRKGVIITALDEDKDRLHSVDFVPRAGAGGTYLTMFESAIGGAKTNAQPQEEAQEMAEAKDLQEATTRITALEADIAGKDAKITELTEAGVAKDTEIAALKESGERTKGEGIVDAKLAEAKLPALTTKRLSEALKAKLPIVEDKLDAEALEAAITVAVTEAAAEIAEVAKGSPVSGMGASHSDADDASAKKSLRETAKRRFLDQGLPLEEAERRAEIFAAGR